MTERMTAARHKELVKTFERAYQYYKGWGFEYLDPPGAFSYYQMGWNLRVFFTPDFETQGVVSVQVARDEGAEFIEGDEQRYQGDLDAPQLFAIVKPWLDKYQD